MGYLIRILLTGTQRKITRSKLRRISCNGPRDRVLFVPEISYMKLASVQRNLCCQSTSYKNCVTSKHRVYIFFFIFFFFFFCCLIAIHVPCKVVTICRLLFAFGSTSEPWNDCLPLNNRNVEEVVSIYNSRCFHCSFHDFFFLFFCLFRYNSRQSNCIALTSIARFFCYFSRARVKLVSRCFFHEQKYLTISVRRLYVCNRMQIGSYRLATRLDRIAKSLDQPEHVFPWQMSIVSRCISVVP